ncbi:MAG: UDP-N-acetylmuramate dehydrogenase [Lachnospiraceae bacterium]|nr:UDP-N-acetylmuramate dehydrogenase [Lachnospiraceae bacterium]
MKDDRIDALRAVLHKGSILPKENLSGHTTFRVGGPAGCFIEVFDNKELEDCISILKDGGEDYFIIGKGSNLLASDEGYKGAVIKLAGEFNEINREAATITAGAGAALAGVSLAAAEASLTGLEFASGIPGSVGGAIVMNAGAYGGEMKDLVKEVTLFDPDKGSIVKLKGEEMSFGYRDSIVKHSKLIVLRVLMELKEGKREEIQELMDELRRKRTEKQPLEYPSAGSTFKRPEGYFAGKLIEDSGLKGYTVGGAMVSEKHCGFVINKGGATAADIKSLIEDVQKTVKEKQGVWLEPELLFLGKL